MVRVMALLVGVCLLNVSLVPKQNPTTQSATTSPQASTFLQQSIAALASGGPPTDSVATGTVTLVAGSQTSSGTVRILTRGSNQTSVQLQTSSVNYSVVYSNGQASRVDSTGTTALPLELASSSQSAYFPLPFLSALLSNPDISLQYVGQEAIASTTANHLRAQNTYQSSSQMQPLSDFTITDIWLDASSALPLRISFVRRDAGGASPKVPISLDYSNYQLVSGIRYPFTIEESVNGTLWATTTISSVTFNNGLTDANFPMAQGAN